MPKGMGERKYLVVAREDVSGCPEAKAIRRANAQTVANFLKENVFARYGCPTSIIVDGGFESKGEVDSICDQLGVKKHMITANYPQANRVVERGHKQLIDGRSKACSGKSPAKCPEYLNDVLWADRITVQKSTGFSPFDLVYGRKCLLPIEAIFSTWQIVDAHEPRTTQELINLRVAQLTQSALDQDLVIENLKKSRLSNKAWFDKSKRLRPKAAIIYENDLVLLHYPKQFNQYTDKLPDKWGGPYPFLKILDGGAYVLTELDGAKLDEAYARNRLKQYWLRSTQKEVEKEQEEREEAGEPDEPNKPEDSGRKKWPLFRGARVRYSTALPHLIFFIIFLISHVYYICYFLFSMYGHQGNAGTLSHVISVNYRKR